MNPSPMPMNLAELPPGDHRLSCPACGRDKRGDRTYSLTVRDDGSVIGQCFRCGHKPERARDPPTSAARAQAASRRAQEKARQAQRWLDAAAVAVRRWDRAPPAIRHNYLTAKGVRAHGLRMEGASLLVPVRTVDGRLQSLQVIDANGTKRYLFGGRITAGFHLLGRIGDRLIIAEGYATGATVHEDTGNAVAVAFDAGNLMSVARAFRDRRSRTEIVIAADDDWQRPENPGRTKAEAAARAIDATVVLPDFTGLPRGPHDTDFNDLRRLKKGRAPHER